MIYLQVVIWLIVILWRYTVKNGRLSIPQSRRTSSVQCDCWSDQWSFKLEVQAQSWLVCQFAVCFVDFLMTSQPSDVFLQTENISKPCVLAVVCFVQCLRFLLHFFIYCDFLHNLRSAEISELSHTRPKCWMFDQTGSSLVGFKIRNVKLKLWGKLMLLIPRCPFPLWNTTGGTFNRSSC